MTDARIAAPALLVCLSLVTGLAPVATAGPSLDIRPLACPNLIDLESRALVPVAVVGDDDFRVFRVDPASLSLRRADGIGGIVAPLSGGLPGGMVADLTSPAASGTCPPPGGDGRLDMVVLFGQRQLVNGLELGALPVNASVELCLHGEFRFGAGTFAVCDTVVLSGLSALAHPDRDGIRDLPSR